jgi:predicted transcriptional regulator
MPEEEENITKEKLAEFIRETITMTANKVFDERKEALKAEIKEEILGSLDRAMAELLRERPEIIEKALKDLQNRP